MYHREFFVNKSYLLMQEVQRQLQSHRLHVGLLQRTGDVHVHVQEALHGATQLGLFDFQLRQQIDKPLERALVAIDPEEVHLTQVHDRLRYLAGPLVVAARTRVPCLPVAMHDRLQYGGERRDADAGGNEHRVLGAKYVTGRSTVRSVNVDLTDENVRI